MTLTETCISVVILKIMLKLLKNLIIPTSGETPSFNKKKISIKKSLVAVFIKYKGRSKILLYLNSKILLFIFFCLSSNIITKKVIKWHLFGCKFVKFIN